ncbi:anaphase-promoting complex component Cut20/Apc4 [Sodiomyces alkalinus F11]|uniref:Anaphase-promoting complex subunit 4 n=1 Tax=Sodiomyces alkalinus (strain CBS 110278 / VKM F-3762 / F11) TaxID=1314773 RepID=A0A3N2Q0S6_SODAK|nr:anaphase-promoting complex component Cut20/Apc4 [Sodiomyces alkalinus F11]ROT40340.1 anaphase-promoting complex component Cut20/Apc4 [Sodiomyces alkalinus F11]
MAEPEPLRLLSETRFDHRVPDGLPKSNPTVDLTATWDASAENLLIYRPKDQVVSKIRQISRPGIAAPEPLALKWKPDGQFLAVGWSDGHVRLMGLEYNKAAHHIPICPDSSAKITHIGWARNIIGNPPNAHSHPSQQDQSLSSWQHDMARELELGDKERPPPVDLPRELTFLEIDASLPKISPLPSSSAGDGEDAMVFTLRTSIEFLFQPFKADDSDQVYIMVVGTNDGRLHLSIYDSFVIGDFRYTLPSAIYRPGVLQLTHHTSHPTMSTHSLFLKHPSDDDRALYLVPMDLPFIPSSPINLSLIASKLTTVQKLLRYVKQAQLHMVVEYNNSRELPSRFMRSVQEDLAKEESGPSDIVPALFHAVVTGHLYPVAREWLVDQLAERGHKRWDKAVTSGLQNLRSLIHENLIPALERLSIILSRLRGLALFYDNRDDIGFSVTQITRAMDFVSCLKVIGHRILLQVMEELDFFNAFSAWLRFQIDRAAQSGSVGDELSDREAALDIGSVLAYVQHYLVQSPMAIFFDDGVTEQEAQADWQTVGEGSSLLDTIDMQLKQHEAGQPYKKGLPHVAYLVDQLDARASGIFRDIAEAQKRSVHFGQPTKMVLQHAMSSMDAVMCPDTTVGDSSGARTFTAITQQTHDSELYIFCTRLKIINGISTKISDTVASLRVQTSGKIVDLKFSSGTTLVLLLSYPGKTAVVQVPVQSPQINYAPYTEGDLPPPQDLEKTLATAEGYRVSPLPDDPALSPIQMEAHSRSEARGEIAPRVCLLGRDRATWKVFVLEDGIQNESSNASSVAQTPRTFGKANKENGRSGKDSEAA